MRLWLVISQLVDGDYLSIVRKRHLVKNHGWDSRHGIGVASPQENVVIERGVNDFDVNTNSLARKSDRTITEEANRLGGVATPLSKGDHGRGQLRRSELLPNQSGHHTGGCPLINYTPRNVSVPYFDGDLEDDGSRTRRMF